MLFLSLFPSLNWQWQVKSKLKSMSAREEAGQQTEIERSLSEPENKSQSKVLSILLLLQNVKDKVNIKSGPGEPKDFLFIILLICFERGLPPCIYPSSVLKGTFLQCICPLSVLTSPGENSVFLWTSDTGQLKPNKLDFYSRI